MEEKIKAITPEEHKQWLKDEIQEKGLYNAVSDQLDKLMADCHTLGYIKYGHLVECSVDILGLIETFGERFGIYKDVVEHK